MSRRRPNRNNKYPCPAERLRGILLGLEGVTGKKAVDSALRGLRTSACWETRTRRRTNFLLETGANLSRPSESETHRRFNEARVKLRITRPPGVSLRASWD
jgi:hypothetical protein